MAPVPRLAPLQRLAPVPRLLAKAIGGFGKVNGDSAKDTDDSVTHITATLVTSTVEVARLDMSRRIYIFPILIREASHSHQAF